MALSLRYWLLFSSIIWKHCNLNGKDEGYEKHGDGIRGSYVIKDAYLLLYTDRKNEPSGLYSSFLATASLISTGSWYRLDARLGSIIRK